MLPGIRNVGLRNYGRFRIHRFRDKLWPCEKLYSLRVDGVRHPLKARGGSSDLSVFSGVFVRRDYSCLDHVNDARLIIDCGANVGYSPAYFLSRYPQAQLIAVEPDATNFELLRENLAPYGERAQLVQAGVWSHSTELTVVDAPYRDGRQWSQQFRERRPGEKAVVATVDVETLLEESGCPRISILKMDVEGAEGVVFGKNVERWIDRVDNIAIELHDDSYFGDCTAIFSRAIVGRGFTQTKHGGITLCRRA
jgi:FkbM family methyltransferase